MTDAGLDPAGPRWGRLREIGAMAGDTILSCGGTFDGKVVTDAMLAVWQQPDYAILQKADTHMKDTA